MSNSINRKFRGIGWDGIAMLLLSTMVIIATLGVTLLGFVVYAIRIARCTPVSVDGCSAVLVPGVALEDNLPNEEFRCRMQRAKMLYDDGCEMVVLLGGITGNSTISEAAAGKQYLVGLGIPEEAILLEESSSNTLENFRFARRVLAFSVEKAALVTSRYHLARCGVMANSLRIIHRLCAAEARTEWSAKSILLLVKEACHLHWYFTGRYWAMITGNEKMLRRLQ